MQYAIGIIGKKKLGTAPAKKKGGKGGNFIRIKRERGRAGRRREQRDGNKIGSYRDPAALHGLENNTARINNVCLGAVC